MILYHGTANRLTDTILKNGLRSNPKGLNRTGRGIYLVDDVEEAKYWADQLRWRTGLDILGEDRKIVVLKVNIPPQFEDKLVKDYLTDYAGKNVEWQGDYVYKDRGKGIPPAWISLAWAEARNPRRENPDLLSDASNHKKTPKRQKAIAPVVGGLR